MNLCEFLHLCDPNMKVAITNENGTGGASYVAWPEHGWTVREAIEELGCGGYYLCGVSIRDGMLYIEADEQPWDYGSYQDGEWYPCETYEYKVHYGATFYVREPDDESAIDMAKLMLSSGEPSFAEWTISDKN